MPKLSCIAPLPQYLNVANQSLNAVHVAVPKVTGRNEKSVCGVQSTHKHTTQPLKSDSALKKSNFVKHHKMRGRVSWDAGIALLGRPRGCSASPSCTRQRCLLPQITVSFILMQKTISAAPNRHVGSSVGSLDQGQESLLPLYSNIIMYTPLFFQQKKRTQKDQCCHNTENKVQKVKQLLLMQ